jgi:hypothetical protein
MASTMINYSIAELDMYSIENRKALEHVNKKWVKVITVITYVISVSLVGLILGLYYKLAWNPTYETDNKSNLIDASNSMALNQISLGTLTIKGIETEDNQVIMVEIGF